MFWYEGETMFGNSYSSIKYRQLLHISNNFLNNYEYTTIVHDYMNLQYYNISQNFKDLTSL